MFIRYLYCLLDTYIVLLDTYIVLLDTYGGSDGKESACSAGDLGLIPGLGRFPGEGNGNPLQYSCLENLMDRGAWWITVHGVAKRVRHDGATNTTLS